MHIRKPTYKKEDVDCKLCTEYRGKKPPGMNAIVLPPRFGIFVTTFRMKQNRRGICPAWVISAAPITRRKWNV